MRALLFPAVFVCLFSSLPALAQKVLENDSTAAIVGDQIVVRIAIDGNNAARQIGARIELLDTADAIKASAERAGVDLAAGKITIEFALPLAGVLETTDEDLAWYRIRYRIGDAVGIISMSRLIRDL